MNIKSMNLYLCSFRSRDVNKGSIRDIKAVARSFGQASTIAKVLSSNWEDSDEYELFSVALIDDVFIFI